MFFTQLAFLAVSASAAYVAHSARNLAPPIATLNAIATELAVIDSRADPENLNSASNTSVAFSVDGTLEAVNAVTLDGSLQVLVCIGNYGVASPSDAEQFIDVANMSYVPTLLSVLNKTIIAKPVFFEDSVPELDLVSFILADLRRYNISNGLYLGNLTLATPTEFLPIVAEITQTITEAFNTAIAAYECPGALTECSSTSTTTSVSGASTTHSASSSSSSVVKSSTASSTSTSPPSATSPAAVLGQCGGIGWTGPTTCVSGSVCTIVNPFFSQCLRTSNA